MVTELPPSTNQLYQSRGGGKLALTTRAKHLRESVKKEVVRKLGAVMSFPVNEDLIYRFDLIAYFPALENPLWFEFWEEDKFYTKDILYKKGPKKGAIQFLNGTLKHQKGARKAATRYKRIDYDNRLKFLQDCVSKFVGIPDDSQIFVGLIEKREDLTFPRAEITVTVVRDVERFFSKKVYP